RKGNGSEPWPVAPIPSDQFRRQVLCVGSAASVAAPENFVAFEHRAGHVGRDLFQVFSLRAQLVNNSNVVGDGLGKYAFQIQRSKHGALKRQALRGSSCHNGRERLGGIIRSRQRRSVRKIDRVVTLVFPLIPKSGRRRISGRRQRAHWRACPELAEANLLVLETRNLKLETSFLRP